MGKTYIDRQWELVEIIESWKKDWVPVMIEVWQEETKNEIKESLENESQLHKVFTDIYNNFNEKKPLENESIQEILQNQKWKIFENIMLFLSFLEEKISKANNKKEISKIPLIISNICSYKWWKKTRNLFLSKKNEIMFKYNERMKKRTITDKKRWSISPFKLK